MQELFKAAVERGASDIHIKAGNFIRARIHGDLQPLTQQRLSAEQVKGIALSLIPHEEDKENFDNVLDYDCSWGIPGVGRFRVNILKQRMFNEPGATNPQGKPPADMTQMYGGE